VIGDKGHHFRSSFHSASASSGSSGMFHTPSKRRRTKVTDTRLSPRNATALRAGLLAANLMQQQSLGGDKKPFGSMMNDEDDQENLDMDSDTNNNNSQDQEDNDSRSSDNENGGGQLATMPNGYPSSYDNNNMINDLGSSSNDYSGYPMSFLNKNKNDNDVNRSTSDSPRFVSLFIYFCLKAASLV
jgi:hypothetical protein